MTSHSNGSGRNDRTRSSTSSRSHGYTDSNGNNTTFNSEYSSRKERRRLIVPDGPERGTSISRRSVEVADVLDNIMEPRKSTKVAATTAMNETSVTKDVAALLQPDEDKDVVNARTKRLRGAWSWSLVTVASTVLAAVLGFLIFSSFFNRQLDPKGCSMAYMWPNFVKMTNFGSEYTPFSGKYSLYLYREGGIDQDARVKGVPVLFIPGNAGSYKQARSIASSAAVHYHQTLQHDAQAQANGKRPLDFFTVDFNEEFSAFHGQTLLDQAEYLNAAISYILSLYHEPGWFLRDKSLPEPTSVILVGHSMGGIVARTMLTLPNYQDQSVNTILTLAAPHARAPVSFDPQILTTYKRINDYWREQYSQNGTLDNKLRDVTLISIAGGALDTIVPSDYSTLASLVPPTHGFTVFSSTIPEVWTSMDHLAIMWCNQLRKAVALSLYDIVDVNHSCQTRPLAERMTAFKRRFLTGMEDVAERTLPHALAETLLILGDDSNTVVPQAERLDVRELGRTGKPRSYLLTVPPSSSERKIFTLLADQKLSPSGQMGAFEVLLCSVHSQHAGQSASFSYHADLSTNGSGSTKLACKNSANDAILLPSSRKENHFPFDNFLEKDWNVLAGRTPSFSYLQYDLEMLAEHEFVVIVDRAPNAVSGWVLAEFTTLSDSIIHTDKSLMNMLTSGIDASFSESMIMNEIKIPSIVSSLLSFKVSVSKHACGDEELFRPILRQHISEPYESKWFVNVKDVEVSMHGVAPYLPPPLKVNGPSKGLALQIWSDPTCATTLNVTMKVDWLGSLGKLWMRYRTVFATFPILVVSVVLRKQFKIYDRTGLFISFSESMDLCLRSSIPVLFLALTIFAVSYPRPVEYSSPIELLFNQNGNVTESIIDFTRNDLLLGSQEPIFCLLVPLFGLISVGICIALNYFVLFVTQVSVLAVSILLRPVARSPDNSTKSLTVTPLKWRIALTCVLLVLVSTVIPYQFVFVIICVIQLVTCIRAMKSARETYAAHHIHFHNYAHAILMLLLWILPTNIPTLVVWIHNLTNHWLMPVPALYNILSIIPYILLVETLSTRHMIPPATTRIRHVSNVLLLILSGTSAIYGVTYAYLLHQIANVVCGWLTLLHLSSFAVGLYGPPRVLGGLTGETKPAHREKQP